MRLLPLSSCKWDPFCLGSHKLTFAFFDPANHCLAEMQMNTDG
jgi:hypothetical protein